jgi:shikimate kinase
MKKGKLIFFCGKMGAGKTTLAAKKVDEMDAVLISEDELLSKLYEGKVTSVSDYKYYSEKLKPVVFNF